MSMSSELPREEPEEDTASTGRSTDDELKCIGAILRVLARQDTAARARIVTYISSRFKEPA